jgi:curli production assembly/transport component CsgF
MKKIPHLIIVLSCFALSSSFGQQLTYRPVNPNFGGDTFNYQFLLQSATVQNSLTAPSVENQEDTRSDLDRFRDNLNNQLLSQISRTLFNQQFDANAALEPGTFSFGSLIVEIFESPEGLVIDILDTSNGDQTQLIIPNN